MMTELVPGARASLLSSNAQATPLDGWGRADRQLVVRSGFLLERCVRGACECSGRGDPDFVGARLRRNAACRGSLERLGNQQPGTILRISKREQDL